MTQTKYEVEADAVKTALDSTYVKKTDVNSDVYSRIMIFGNALLTELGTVSDGDDVNY